MKTVIKILLPVLVLLLCGAIGFYLIDTAPQAERRRPPPATPVVEVVAVQPQDYPVILESRGTVTPRTESTLIPEVSGQVVWIADKLRKGGFFEPGDALVKIDPRNYETAVTIAASELAQARLQLQEEQARAEQAARDWDKLGLAGEPDELVLRMPQMGSARASVAAAEARLRRAEIDLERTRISALYAGRVLEKNVDIGQFVNSGSVLARIYAVDYVEIRLPLTSAQIAFLDLPETYRNGGTPLSPVPVVIKAEIGGSEYQWDGRVVRSEGAIDTASRQWFVVAQVDDPYARHGDRPPLKVGQFVLADIAGRTLENVYLLPDSAVRIDDQVIVVDREHKIRRVNVEVLLSRDGVSVVRGLAPGQLVSMTDLPFAGEGAAVRIAGEPVERGGVAAQPGGARPPAVKPDA
jgi:RND family efflux transporter MFP subunit